MKIAGNSLPQILRELGIFKQGDGGSACGDGEGGLAAAGEEQISASDERSSGDDARPGDFGQ